MHCRPGGGGASHESCHQAAARDGPAWSASTSAPPTARNRHPGSAGQKSSRRRPRAAARRRSPAAAQWCAWFSARRPSRTARPPYVPNSAKAKRYRGANNRPGTPLPQTALRRVGTGEAFRLDEPARAKRLAPPATVLVGDGIVDNQPTLSPSTEPGVQNRDARRDAPRSTRTSGHGRAIPATSAAPTRRRRVPLERSADRSRSSGGAIRRLASPPSGADAA